MTSDKLAATFHGASLTDTLRPILDWAWTLVFKLAERRFPPDEPQSFDEAARVRARWIDKHRRKP